VCCAEGHISWFISFFYEVRVVMELHYQQVSTCASDDLEFVLTLVTFNFRPYYCTVQLAKTTSPDRFVIKRPFFVAD
jgi:hypothetical protein